MIDYDDCRRIYLVLLSVQGAASAAQVVFSAPPPPAENMLLQRAPAHHASRRGRDMDEPLGKIQKAGYTASVKGKTKEWKGAALSAT